MEDIKEIEDPVVLIQLGRMNKKSTGVANYLKEKLEPKVFCKFCGRELKNAKSVKNGYGQGCYKKWVKSRSHKRRLI